MLFRFRYSTYWPLYFKLWRLLQSLEKQIAKISHTKKLENQIQLAVNAARNAVIPTGYFSNYDIEKVFLDAAQMIPEVECKPQQNSYLHVVTSSNVVGGHTGALGRWIESSQLNEKHSIVVLNQTDKNPFPYWLVTLPLRHGGDYIEFHEQDLMKRAYLLRKLSSHYSKIILYTHDEDATPIVAFGTKSFINPVILFNHSDHLFWLGVSIADVVADICYNDYTTTRRKSKNAYFLGIPPIQDNHERKYSEVASSTKKKIREELGIPINAFVIITCGNSNKFKPVNRNSLAQQFASISNDNRNIYCYAIGPDVTRPEWRDAFTMSEGHVIALGIISNKEIYDKYLYASDLYIGSYPIGSLTALMDAVQHNLPPLIPNFSKQCKFGINKGDESQECWCHSVNELDAKMRRASSDHHYLYEVWKSASEFYDDYCNYDKWCERKEQLYLNCPSTHSIYSFINHRGDDTYIDDYVARSAITEGIHYGNKFLNKLNFYLIKF